MSNLKLFVWHEVFYDYTPGMAFALAETEEEARKLIIDQMNISESSADDLTKEPEVYEVTDRVGFGIWGGG